MAENTNWYAVRTQNNREKSVLEKLKLELIRSGIENVLNRYLIPTEKVFSIRNGKKYAREKIVYPGYLFIETKAVGELSNILKGINGAAGFVRTRSGDINPLKEYEVKKMLNEQENNDAITPENSNFSIGESVKVIDGPFTTFKGKIHNIDKEKSKVKVEVLVFSRPTVLELDFLQIERDI
jgi:transcriptional antiterminator NusG